MPIDKKNVFLKIIIAMDNDDSQKTRTTSIAVIAIIAALGLLGIVVLTVTVAIPLQQQQAEARQPPGKGCEFTPGGNASKARCVH
jgi:hypothetical protein